MIKPNNLNQMRLKKRLKVLIYLSLIFVVITIPSFRINAQLLIQNNLTPQQLVQQILVGSGVTVMNVQYTGAINAKGSFSNGATTNLGINEGVVLSSGNVFSIPAAATVFASTNNGTPGDPQLNGLIPGSTFDAAALEFDFIPQSDTLTFNYVFGSEEYPEYVCSSFNDVFGFFVTGPNPANPFNPYNNYNIAIIPESFPPLPVAINTINNWPNGSSYPSSGCQSTSFSHLYIDNQAIGGTTIVFDGFTRVLTATLIVVPCETYHIKLAVADAGDHIYDSGVFLEANSFSSPGLNTSLTFSNSSIFFGSAVEACNDAILNFELEEPRYEDFIIEIEDIFGTAILDEDYLLFPPTDTLIIPAGELSIQLVISPLSDFLIEGTEEAQFIFAYEEACANAIDTTTITILDNTLGFASFTGDTVYCVTDPPDTLIGLPSGGVFSGPGINGNMFDPSQANLGKNKILYTVYFIDITVFGNDTMCINEVMKEIVVIDGPSADAGPDDVIAEGETYTLNGQSLYYDSTYWITSGTGAFDDPLILNATYTPSFQDITNGSVILSLTAWAQEPCPGDSTDSMLLTIASGTTAIAGEDATICEGDVYQLTGNGLFFNTVEWTTSGDGTFDNATIMDPVYTPGPSDIAAGIVTITFTVYGSSIDSDEMNLTIIPAAVADAGGPATINEGENYTLNGMAANYTSMIWLTSGDGNFSDATVTDPVYYPGFNDNMSGSVILTFIVNGQSPCGPDTSTMMLTILSSTSANAGTDATICADEFFTLNGSGAYYINTTWTTSGDGSFNDPGLMDATYYPSTNDILDSTIVLTLTVYGSDTVSDDMILYIHPLAESPTLLTSSLDNFCSGSTGQIQLVSTGGSGNNIRWFEDACGMNELGTGTFLTINAPLETTIYYSYWENMCGVSQCAEVTVTVIQNLDVQVSINASKNPIEAGETVVFTASPQNGGSNPEYTWMIDGTVVQTGPENTYVSSSIADGQVISVELYSSEQCVLKNPVYNEILMGVNFRPTIHTPNAFSPNDDGKNDKFRVYGPVDEIIRFQLQIYDRWGAKLFETEDLQEGWDGTIDGKPAPAGVYVWIADYTIRPSAVVSEGETHQEKGNLVLVR